MTATRRTLSLDRLAGRLARLTDVDAVADEALRTMVSEVGAVFGCLALTDPLTGVITWAYKSGPLDIGDEQWVGFEYGDPDINQFIEILERPAPVGIVSIDTDGDIARCRRLGEYLTPRYGFTDELRVVFRAHGLVWGMVALYRGRSDPPFTAGDGQAILAVGPDIADAIRVALFAAPGRPGGGDATRATGASDAAAADPTTSDPGGGWYPEPAVVVVDERGRPRQLTRSAQALIEQVGGYDHGELPSGLLAAAARARAGAGLFVSRIRTASGPWLTVRASTLEDADGRADVVLTMDVARTSELNRLTLAGRGLTAREQDVVNLVIKGASTKDVAATLFLSPHTVQDHLKAVFTKFGVNSRRELIAQLYD